MDKFPLCWRGKALGEVTVKADTLYSCFEAQCPLPWQGLWCVWLIGEQGELRLGVMEPQGDGAAIRRRFSGRMTAPLGRILRGELRPVASAGAAAWELMEENPFRTPWLRRQLQGTEHCLIRQSGPHRFVAVPYDGEMPFPLPPLFCFARIRRIGGEDHAIFAFDEEEWPVFFE